MFDLQTLQTDVIGRTGSVQNRVIAFAEGHDVMKVFVPETGAAHESARLR